MLSDTHKHGTEAVTQKKRTFHRGAAVTVATVVWTATTFCEEDRRIATSPPTYKRLVGSSLPTSFALADSYWLKPWFLNGFYI